MSMYVLIGKDEEGKPKVLDFAEHGAELQEKLVQYEEEKPSVWIQNHWYELSGDAINICRSHLEQAGTNGTFFDDGVFITVLELLELRRRFNDGKTLNLSATAEGWDPKALLCDRCRLPQEHHQLKTVKCEGYQAPPEPEAPAKSISL
jgi:hypothetical protein